MTLQETKKLLITINALYPQWKVANPEATSAAWHWALEEYPADAINAALQIFLKTDKAGFAPSVSQIIACMHAPKTNEYLTEGEAWALVKKAIADGNYHSEERYNELPETVQRAVGGPQMLRQWAMCDTSEVNTVIMSNFQRTYKAILNKQDFNNKVPPQIAEVINGVVQQIEQKG